MNKILNRKTLKVTRHWFNGFAQNCYQLEDGTTLFISYNNDNVTIEQTELVAVEDEIAFINSLPQD